MPSATWDLDVHTHRHSIHTFHHEWLDRLLKRQTEAIQPYATLQILFTSKRITKIHRAVMKIFAEKMKMLCRLMTHAWVASTIRPDRCFERKKPRKPGRCHHQTINLTYIIQHQPLRGSFAAAADSVTEHRRDCDYRTALFKVTLQASQKQQKKYLQQGLAQYLSHLVQNVSLSHVGSFGRHSSHSAQARRAGK